MRHLWSLIAGVVVAPLGWGLLAMGQAGASATNTSWAVADAFDTADLVKPACYLAAAGILFGLIATPRISPLGPLVAALVYLGLNVGMFIDPFEVRDAVPNNWKVLGETIPLRTPLLNGTLLAVGALLLVAVFSAKRWRQWPAAEPVLAEPEAPGPIGEEPAGLDTWPQRVPAPEPVTAVQPPMAAVPAPAAAVQAPTAAVQAPSTAVQPPSAAVQAPSTAVQPPVATPYAAPQPAPAEPTTASWPPPSPATEPVRPPDEAVRAPAEAVGAPAEPIPPPAEPARPASPPRPEPASGPTSAPPAAPMTAPAAPVWPPQSEPGADEPAGPRHAAENAADNGEQSPGDSPPSPWSAPPPSR